jgi:hypothetical protein
MAHKEIKAKGSTTRGSMSRWLSPTYHPRAPFFGAEPTNDIGSEENQTPAVIAGRDPGQLRGCWQLWGKPDGKFPRLEN